MKYSNCLFEAIKAKLKDPKNIKIIALPKSLLQRHYAWTDGKTVTHAFRRDSGVRCTLLFVPKFKTVSIETFTRWVLGNTKDINELQKYAKKWNLPISNIDGILNTATYSDDEDNIYFDDSRLSKEDFETVKKCFGFEPQVKIFKDQKMKVVSYDEYLQETGTFVWKLLTPFDPDFKWLFNNLVSEDEISEEHPWLRKQSN